MNHTTSAWIAAAATAIALVALSGIGWYWWGLGGAAPEPETPPHSSDSGNAFSVERLAQGGWRLTHMTDNEGVEVRPEAAYEIAFSERRIAGEICNVFSGSMDVGSEGALAFGPVQSTRKLCDGVQMDIERRFLEGLQEGMAFSLSEAGNRLTLAERESGFRFDFEWHP